MAKNAAGSRVRFLAGWAPRPSLLGVLAFPVALDGKDAEHTRFYMVTPERWTHRPIDADLVSAAFEDGPNGKCWWLLGKRGDVYAIRPSGMTAERIPDAGTGPGGFGYLSKLQMIGSKLFACGFSRQVYERRDAGWVHADQGILLDPDQMDLGLNDIAGSANGDLCAVGDEGEIAYFTNNRWTMVDSPTNAHLYALCTDENGDFVACGANGIVVRGAGPRFASLTDPGDFDETLWDVEVVGGEIVVAATSGLYAVRNGTLTPFDRPPAPVHVGYRLVKAGNVVWSVGTHQIYCLDNGRWSEWVCPDN